MLISLITIHKPNCPFLSQCISSVHSQTDTNFEYIICPDTGLGYTQTLKDIISISKGDWFAVVDSDDILLPSAIQSMKHFISLHPPAGIIYSYCQVINANGDYIKPLERNKIPFSSFRMLVDNIPFHFKLVNKHIYNQVGGLDPRFKVCQDYDLNMRISEVSPVLCFPTILYSYRIHSNQVSQTKRKEQILNSETIIREAIQRRGLQHKVTLNVDYENKLFKLTFL